MRRDGGAVLINALVIVLALSAIAAALLTRSEGARVRAGAAQESAQMDLYLDAAEALLPALLREPAETGGAHAGQPWASGPFDYQIDRGTVSAEIADLQGRLNVNWLVSPDAFVTESFGRLFAEIGAPPSLAAAIADFLQPGGPAQAAAYLSRQPPMRPRGGAVATLPQLRAVEGMTPELFRKLEPYVSALPVDARLNLNTAPKPVLRAVLAPFPADLVAETLARGADNPLDGLRDFRNRLIEILGTEEVDDYPIDRLGAGSDWFAARLTARLGDRVRMRDVVLQRVVVPAPRFELAHRWAVLD